jgi:hypothetical protein
MRRRVARSATRPRDPWSAAGALVGPAGRLVLECVAGASHIWWPWSCQTFPVFRHGSSASSRTVSVQECIDLYVDFCQGSAGTVQRADAWRPTSSGFGVPNLDSVLFGLLAVRCSVGSQLPALRDQLATAREGMEHCSKRLQANGDHGGG